MFNVTKQLKYPFRYFRLRHIILNFNEKPFNVYSDSCCLNLRTKTVEARSPRVGFIVLSTIQTPNRNGPANRLDSRVDTKPIHNASARKYYKTDRERAATISLHENYVHRGKKKKKKIPSNSRVFRSDRKTIYDGLFGCITNRQTYAADG